MADLHDIEKAHETKFVREAELQFKAEARRNRLAGLWAAGLLGKTGEAAEQYAQNVIAADFIEAGSEDVVRLLTADLGDRASPETIRAKLAEFLAVARTELGLDR